MQHCLINDRTFLYEGVNITQTKRTSHLTNRRHLNDAGQAVYEDDFLFGQFTNTPYDAKTTIVSGTRICTFNTTYVPELQSPVNDKCFF